jgi:phosphatidate cytidylyltransferase
LRLLSAAFLLLAVVLTVWVLPPVATVVLVAVVAATAGAELAGMAGRVGAPVPAVFLGLASAALAVALAVFGRGGAAGGEAVFPAVLLGFVVVAGVVALRLGPPTPQTLSRAAVLFMAPGYLGLPLGSVAWTQAAYGPAATSWLVGAIAASDSAQYYCGRLFGRRQLAPSISPAKTVEGAIGGVLAAGTASALLGPWSLPGLSPMLAAFIGVVLSTSGIAGDLFESLLKRSAGVKDSGAMIPGHGGVLDRIDSYLFAAPVFFLFLRYVQ